MRLIHPRQLSAAKIEAFNMDAREFVKRMAQEHLRKISKTASIHFIMNLPATATEFLDVFKELLPSFQHFKSTLLHVYSFSKDVDPARDIQNRIETILGQSCCPQIVHHVRNVAPNKEMYCISFPLHSSLSPQGQGDCGNEAKRAKLDILQ